MLQANELKRWIVPIQLHRREYPHAYLSYILLDQLVFIEIQNGGAMLQNLSTSYIVILGGHHPSVARRLVDDLPRWQHNIEDGKDEELGNINTN